MRVRGADARTYTKVRASDSSGSGARGALPALQCGGYEWTIHQRFIYVPSVLIVTIIGMVECSEG